MQVYYDKDADLDIIKNKKVVITDKVDSLIIKVNASTKVFE